MSSEPNLEQVHSLIRLIYESAADPLLWPLFLRDFCEAVRASAAGIVFLDSSDGRTQVDASFNVDPAYQASFIQHYGAINPWTTGEAARLWTPGCVLEGRELISDEEMLKTEFYNDFLKPQGSFSALGCSINQSASTGGYVTVLRPRSVPPDEGRRLLATLTPHLQTAMRLHQRICNLETTVLALSDALDHLPGGVVIVDIAGKVLIMNRAAERILVGNNGLRNDSDGLSAFEDGKTLALRTTIAAAIKARDGATEAPVPFAISRSAGRRPLQILVAPLPPQIAGTSRQPSAILFISDPDDIPEPNRELLQATFGLTEAEARVAAALTFGKSVEHIAAEFHVAPDTVRTHLKRVFAKTDTNRQGELIRLLLTTWSTLRLSGKIDT